ncbi:MAG: transporter substrate-binding domain-containing protein [Halioglobus sp.]|nr:transporter substrate-binding domain-containing protein [Halioglobus sp.]
MSNVLKPYLLSSFFAWLTFLSPGGLTGDTLERVVDFQVVTVGMSGNQPPMTMVNREGGLMGFDVDLAQALAMAMNVALDIQRMPFGELMGALEKGEIDMVISNLSITPARTERVSFVGPYMMSGQSILTRSKSMADLTSAEEFNSKDLKILALQNSTHVAFVKGVAPEATLIEVPSYDDGVTMLMDNKADLMVADMTQCILAVMRFPDAGFTTLDKPLTLEPIGIAVSKDDAQFFNLVDNLLRAYEKTGVLNQMREKWFEENTWIAAMP